ncbi:MAG: hypothetical protein M3296_03640 [Actinomycetota bacterium]|nr:hypothetical protein [Actinomycetota bacterium]
MASKGKAAKAKAAKAGSAAAAARKNPYVQRILEDQELRDNMVVAVDAARNAYSRLNNGKAPAKVLMDDKKLHKELRRSADALRDASSALREGPKKKKRRGGLVRLLLLAVAGGAIALAASENLRNKVLDALFGSEEEFDYSSTTAPASSPSAAPA